MSAESTGGTNVGGARQDLSRTDHIRTADDSPELRWLFSGSNPGAHLAEYVIHHYDLARPLGLRCEVPSERMIAALDGVTHLPGVRLRARWLLFRRHWHATDLDWTRGRGPRVDAHADAILMTLAGRGTIR